MKEKRYIIYLSSKETFTKTISDSDNGASSFTNHIHEAKMWKTHDAAISNAMNSTLQKYKPQIMTLEVETTYTPLVLSDVIEKDKRVIAKEEEHLMSLISQMEKESNEAKLKWEAQQKNKTI